MIFTDENGHVIVTFGEGTTAICPAKEIDSEVENTIFFVHREKPIPLGESIPDLANVRSELLPEGTVRFVFTGKTKEDKVKALWNFLHLIDPLVEANRKVMEENCYKM